MKLGYVSLALFGTLFGDNVVHRKYEVVAPVFHEGQIKNVDLNLADTIMYHINSSGRYYVANDLVVNPEVDGASFIKISSSNVLLDLNSRTIAFDMTSDKKDCVAIEIAPDVTNVVIMNGSVIGINGNGIKIGNQASQITLSSLKIGNCTETGLAASKTHNLHISELNVFDCNGSSVAATFANGARLVNCDNITIEHSDFSNNRATSSGTPAVFEDAVGLWLKDCSNVILNNCNFGLNRGNECAGLKLSTCNSCAIKECVFAFNESIDGQAHGCALHNCKSVSLAKCVSQSNLSSGKHAIGFLAVACNGITITDSVALTNVAESPAGEAYGFRLILSSGSQILHSKSMANSAAGACYGFFVGNKSNNNLLKGCQSQGNISTGSVAGSDGVGFQFSGGRGNRLDSCMATGNNGGSHANSIGNGVGFVDGEKYSVIVDCEIFDNGSVNGEGYGIKFGRHSLNCVVTRNKIYNNIGGTKKYGFKDFSDDMTSFLTSNISYGHGKVLPLHKNLIVDDGAKNYMFKFSNRGEKPTSMIKETDVSTIDTLATSIDYDNISVYSK